MPDNRQDPSQAKYSTAIEENLFAFIPLLGRLGRMEVNAPPGVKRSICDLPISLFNSIMDARLAPSQVDSAIQTILSDAAGRKVPILWWMSPSTRPADLGDHLKDHGFILDDDSPGMAVDLQGLNEDLPKPEGFSIQLAQDETAWRQWSIAVQTAYDASPPKDLNVNAWSSILRQSDPNTVYAFTGSLDDKPVATSLLLLAGGAAGIYAVGTLPEARRKGIGAWMTLHPLLLARSMGFKTGVLFASEMGVGVYRSLGFQEYCRIVAYLWEPERSIGV
jgi:ribosomal protein S18 acetylase RimI-like enzyme